MPVQNSRKYLLALMLCLQFMFGQSQQQTITPTTPGNAPAMEERMKALTDSMNKASLQRGMENSYRFFEEYQRKERKKKQQQMILYFSLGAGMLAILAYGLRRRKKQGL